MSTHQAPMPLCQAPICQLLIIDAQERLAAAMDRADVQATVENINRLIETAKILKIPIISTEHYPQGLGATIEAIRETLPEDVVPTKKTCFSCCTATGFENNLMREQKRKQVVMVGMESHICIIQTASGLQRWGYQVFVASDAVCSRNPANRDNALERMRQCGIQVTNTESVAFEWLADSTNERFREVLAIYRDKK